MQPSDVAPMTTTPLAPLSTQQAVVKSLVLHALLLIGVVVATHLQKAPPASDSPRVVEAVLVAADTLEGAPTELAPTEAETPTASAPPETKAIETKPAEAKPAETKATVANKAPVADNKASANAKTTATTNADAAKLKQPVATAKPDAKTDAKADKKNDSTTNKKPLPTLAHNDIDDEAAAIEKELKASEAKRQAAAAAQAAQRSADSALRDRFQRLIHERVEKKWSRPASARNGMVASFRVTTLPDGQITNIVLLSSSGDSAFDKSAENAIWHSAPLPVPSDANVFNQYFRIFTLKFNPDDL